MATKQFVGLTPEIAELRLMRSKLVQNEDKYKEAEIAYQMISLYLGLQEVLSGKDYSKEYLFEKSQVVVKLLKDLFLEPERV